MEPLNGNRKNLFGQSGIHRGHSVKESQHYLTGKECDFKPFIIVYPVSQAINSSLSVDFDVPDCALDFVKQSLGMSLDEGKASLRKGCNVEALTGPLPPKKHGPASGKQIGSIRKSSHQLGSVDIEAASTAFPDPTPYFCLVLSIESEPNGFEHPEACLSHVGKKQEVEDRAHIVHTGHCSKTSKACSASTPLEHDLGARSSFDRMWLNEKSSKARNYNRSECIPPSHA